MSHKCASLFSCILCFSFDNSGTECNKFPDFFGQFSVDIEHPYRLLFIPANDPVPRNENGGIDREKVTEIEKS